MDLTKENDVFELMKTSKNVQEWNINCDKVKTANNGNYPNFWFAAIIMKGLPGSLGIDDQIYIINF